MTLRSTVPALIAAAAVLCITVPAITKVGAQENGAGDAERGRKLSYTCYGCHGIPSYKNVYPTYSVPKLQGQRPEYLVAALQAYRGGDRSHGTMHAQAASLSDEDMQDIAAFLAGDVVQAQDADPAAVPTAVEACTACHGVNGVGLTPLYPTLAGQHEDYIERALHDYKSGARKNGIMAGFAAQLSEADIAAAAAYYSSRRPSLSTAEHAIWFTAEK